MRTVRMLSLAERVLPISIAVMVVLSSSSCSIEVSGTRVTMVNLPPCVGAIQVVFTQVRGSLTAQEQASAGVSNQQAVFENLSDRLEAANFDLDQPVSVQVSLLNTGPECQGFGLRSGEVRILEEQNTQLDYSELR